MGIKDFFRKIGHGIRKAGRWVRDRAIPAIGRIAKPIMNVIGLLPGKLGMIGKIGSAVTGVLHGAVEKIPNKDIRDKLDRTMIQFKLIHLLNQCNRIGDRD